MLYISFAYARVRACLRACVRACVRVWCVRACIVHISRVRASCRCIHCACLVRVSCVRRACVARASRVRMNHIISWGIRVSYVVIVNSLFSMTFLFSSIGELYRTYIRYGRIQHPDTI